MQSQASFKSIMILSGLGIILVASILFFWQDFRNHEKGKDIENKVLDGIVFNIQAQNAHKKNILASKKQLEEVGTIKFGDKEFDSSTMIHLLNDTYENASSSEKIISNKAYEELMKGLKPNQVRLVTLVNKKQKLTGTTSETAVMKGDDYSIGDFIVGKEEFANLNNNMKGLSVSGTAIGPFTKKEAKYFNDNFFPQREIVEIGDTDSYLLLSYVDVDATNTSTKHTTSTGNSTPTNTVIDINTLGCEKGFQKIKKGKKFICEPNKHNINLISNISELSYILNGKTIANNGNHKHLASYKKDYTIDLSFNPNKYFLKSVQESGMTCQKTGNACAFTMPDNEVEITYDFLRVCLIPQEVIWKGYTLNMGSEAGKKIISGTPKTITKEISFNHAVDGKVILSIAFNCDTNGNLTITPEPNRPEDKICEDGYMFDENHMPQPCIPEKTTINLTSNIGNQIQFSLNGEQFNRKGNVAKKGLYGNRYTATHEVDGDIWQLESIVPQNTTCEGNSGDATCIFRLGKKEVTINHIFARKCELPTEIHWRGFTVSLPENSGKKILSSSNGKLLTKTLPISNGSLSISIQMDCGIDGNIITNITPNKSDDQVCDEGYEFKTSTIPQPCVPKQHHLNLTSNIGNDATFKLDGTNYSSSGNVNIEKAFKDNVEIDVVFDADKYKFQNKTSVDIQCENTTDSVCRFAMPNKDVNLDYNFIKVCKLPDNVTKDGHTIPVEKAGDKIEINTSVQQTYTKNIEHGRVEYNVTISCNATGDIETILEPSGDTTTWCNRGYEWDNQNNRCVGKNWGRNSYPIDMSCGSLGHINEPGSKSIICDENRTGSSCQLYAVTHPDATDVNIGINKEDYRRQVCTKIYSYSLKNGNDVIPAKGGKSSYIITSIGRRDVSSYKWNFVHPAGNNIRATIKYYRNCVIPKDIRSENLRYDGDYQTVGSPIVPVFESQERTLKKKISHGHIEGKFSIGCGGVERGGDYNKFDDFSKTYELDGKISQSLSEIKDISRWKNRRAVCDSGYGANRENTDCIKLKKTINISISGLEISNASCNSSLYAKIRNTYRGIELVYENAGRESRPSSCYITLRGRGTKELDLSKFPGTATFRNNGKEGTEIRWELKYDDIPRERNDISIRGSQYCRISDSYRDGIDNFRYDGWSFNPKLNTGERKEIWYKLSDRKREYSSWKVKIRYGCTSDGILSTSVVEREANCSRGYTKDNYGFKKVCK